MTTVIYHSADFDGIFCREIAKKFLGDKDVSYIGWNFGDSLIPFPDEGIVYVLDLSPECFTLTKDNLPTRSDGDFDGNLHRLIWIDHHKTSIEKFHSFISGYRIDGVAACRLAWQWFRCVDGNAKREESEIGIPIRPAGVLPMVQDFKHREVEEPYAVTLAGEYDIWDKRDPNAETFQYGLQTWKTSFESLLSDDIAISQSEAFKVIDWGKTAQVYAQQVDASICRSRTWLMEWEGLKFLCLNSARFNSLSFSAKDVPETGHDALLGFCFNGKIWTISLYHAKHNTTIDLSAIAKKYSGGGHKGACGFTCKILPFKL